jgi:hypothetical protein
MDLGFFGNLVVDRPTGLYLSQEFLAPSAGLEPATR